MAEDHPCLKVAISPQKATRRLAVRLGRRNSRTPRRGLTPLTQAGHGPSPNQTILSRNQRKSARRRYLERDSAWGKLAGQAAVSTVGPFFPSFPHRLCRSPSAVRESKPFSMNATPNSVVRGRLYGRVRTDRAEGSRDLRLARAELRSDQSFMAGR